MSVGSRLKVRLVDFCFRRPLLNGPWFGPAAQKPHMLAVRTSFFDALVAREVLTFRKPNVVGRLFVMSIQIRFAFLGTLPF